MKGSTYAAKPRLPTNCSSNLEFVPTDAIMASTLERYFGFFLFPNRHDCVTEQYKRPRITKLLAGPRVLTILNRVAIARPA